MHQFPQLQALREDYRNRLSNSFYVFIAPQNVNEWHQLNIWDFIDQRREVPQSLLERAGELDVFAIAHAQLADVAAGDLRFAHRHSDGRLARLAQR